MTENTGFILTLSCPDRTGIVAAVTTLLAEQGALITEAQHFRDELANSTLLRVVFIAPEGKTLHLETLSRAFLPVAQRLGMTWKLRPLERKLRVLIAVSKQGHCLNSLLHRWSVGSLHIDVVGVVSNHPDQRALVEWHGLQFHHLPIAAGTPDAKEKQEQQMLTLFTELRADILVLARYMQILSGKACRELAGRAINIHHSFLPGFKGAKPYHQAHLRGVKLIGATAHYVNEDLDEGPIIEQDVERVDHNMNVEQLTTLGNEIESRVLNRAVQWLAEDRVFEFGNRAVVMR